MPNIFKELKARFRILELKPAQKSWKENPELKSAITEINNTMDCFQGRLQTAQERINEPENWSQESIQTEGQR